MGRLNRDEVKVNVTGIIPFCNSEYAGIKLIWDGNIGFGEYTIYSEDKDKQGLWVDMPEECQEYVYSKWNGKSEYMDSNDDKWFIKKLLESLVEQMEIEE